MSPGPAIPATLISGLIARAFLRISTDSSGLRTLLIAQKIMLKHGQMIVRGCNEDVMDIFAITGFKDILNIQ